MFLELLLPWVRHVRAGLTVPRERPELKYYGTGHNNWGVQTNQKAFAAFAVTAALAGEAELARTGLTRAALQADAIALFRYSLASHIEGDYHCIDGTKWGHTWISGLGITRMMHAFEAIREQLSAGDIRLFERVLCSEADWLLEHYPVVAGPVDQNKPESNIWNGVILLTAASLTGAVPNRERYIEKGNLFFKNGLSTVGEVGLPGVVGGNFFDSFALHHHYYLNVGYMYICLSNIAMFHYQCKDRGIPPPESLYHHVEALWKLCKSLTFEDGRLWRIGGDTRVRYCYCQDYALPVWVFAHEYLRDNCADKIRQWTGQVKREFDCNGDGSFLSTRCAALADRSPLYGARLESDRACTLSQAAWWTARYGTRQDPPQGEELSGWQDEYHGSAFVRGPHRLASFTWRGAEGAVATCLPRDGSGLAEWRHNLVGEIGGMGALSQETLLWHNTRWFDGGFLTYGESLCRSEMYLEGQADENIATKRIAYAALPDGKTVLTIQRATAQTRAYIHHVKGLCLQIPNDIFNGMSRRYLTDRGPVEIGGEALVSDLKRLSVGGLGVGAVTGTLSVYHPPVRQIGLSKTRWQDYRELPGSLWCDEILTTARLTPHWIDRGEVLYDDAVVLVCGSEAELTAVQQGARMPAAGESVRAVQLTGTDGQVYLLLCNLSDEDRQVRPDLPGGRALVNLCTAERVSGGRDMSVRLPGNTAVLYRLD
ncbi:MAG: hypothetical protein WDA00_03635 [Eubacteriales bacterium]